MTAALRTADAVLALAIAACAGALGFGMVWHMWWFAALALAGIAACLVMRSLDTAIEEKIRI